MATWRKLIEEAMKGVGETWKDVISEVYENEDGTIGSPDAEFDDNYGYCEGCYFTVWTRSNVYFPIEYDGSESVGRVSRHPDGKATAHQQ